MKTILAILLLSARVLAADPQVHRDLPYAEPKNERQTLDVYAPAEGTNHPIVFWIHGGGWQTGKKTDVQKKPQAFVEKGFVFVSTNYRLVPDVTIKAIAEDVAKAICWTHDHAKEYGGDPNTIFVMGHSAGAQLAALICTDERYLKSAGLSLSIIKGCVPVDGDTYDVPMQIATEAPGSADSHRRKFGDEASQQDLSPVTHIAKEKGIPPFLVLHVADHPETKAQAERLVRALRQAEAPARAFPAEGKNHGTINADLGLSDDKPTQAMWEFLKSPNLIQRGDDAWTATELERDEKTSTIRITHKKGMHMSPVGDSLGAVVFPYEIAKARKCEYVVILKEGIDDDGAWRYVVGFTNKKDADIKQEFGDKYSDETESVQERKFMSVSEWSSRFKKDP